ncbi:MAG: PEP-CTERM sorting domain-containing protein [Verrucomicrobiaceae bacterium]|nr:PEP-CTERM sorting domain-containing protein [Verrucomicrobiaceae bacterium]
MRRFWLAIVLTGVLHAVTAVNGAVFVYETAISQQAQFNSGGLLLSGPGGPQLPQLGRISIGTGYFRVEGDQVDFQLWIQPYSGPLDTLQLLSGGVSAEVALGAGTYVYSQTLFHFSNPYLPPPAWMQIVTNPDGSITLNPYYMYSIPSVSEYNIFTGTFTNAALAALFEAGHGAEMMVFGSGGPSDTSPQGTLIFVGTPEPGRGMLILGGGVWLVLRRRRVALGVG